MVEIGSRGKACDVVILVAYMFGWASVSPPPRTAPVSGRWHPRNNPTKHKPREQAHPILTCSDCQ